MSHEIRGDTADLKGDQHEQLLAWVRSLGLNPGDFSSQFLIRHAISGGYELHLRRALKHESGHDRIDWVTDELATEPAVFDLDEQTWPAFLGRWA